MALLEIKKVRKSYKIDKGVETQVLKGINLSFEAGEFVSILGESGCGKSTLMNVIGLMDTKFEGDVLINGKSLHDLKGTEVDDYRKENIGFIFQSFNLINHLTVIDNVMLAMELLDMTPKEREARAKLLLEEVGLKDHLYKKPSQLSGGQKQRVSIARALANDPDIILADEPTGALDKNTTEEILQLLANISKQGRLVIAVTHSSRVADFGTRVVSIDDGVILSDTKNKERIDVTKEMVTSVENKKSRKLTYGACQRLALRNMKLNLKRNILVAFGGSIGIASLILMLSMGSGAKSFITDAVEESSSPNMVEVSKKGEEEAMNPMGGTVPIEQSDIDKIMNLDLVTKVEPVVIKSMSAQLTDAQTGKNVDLFMLTTTNDTTKPVNVTAGELPSEGEIALSTIGATMLAEDKNAESMVGKTVTFTLREMNENNEPVMIQKELVVSGLYDMDTPLMDSPIGFISYEELAGIYEESSLTLKPSQLNVFTNNEADAEALRGMLADMGFDKSETAMMLDMLTTILDMVTALFTGIGGISLVVSGVMILVVLYISVVERTKEIGILRAIGARKKDVKRIFMVESALLGISSGLIAIAAVLVISFIGNPILIKLFDAAIIEVRPEYLVFGFLVSVLVSVISGVFPANKAAKLDPIESLRYE